MTGIPRSRLAHVRSGHLGFRRLHLEKTSSLRRLCITSYPINSISKNALRYTYDLAGNRLSEQVSQKTLLAGTDAQTDVLYQDNHLAYDALNRLRVVGNDQANVSIHYDRVGNRSRIETNVFTIPGDLMDGQASHQQHQTFTYDAMNRQTSVQTSFDSGANSLLATSMSAPIEY